MTTYTFTLVLGEFPRIDEEIAERLFAAGCDDALPGVRFGVSVVEFDREASSFLDAVASAKADVERADPRLRVWRVEPDDLVSMSEIARRSGRTRESIGQLARGQRGPRDFPPPIRGLTTKSPLWSWARVARWLADNDKLEHEVADQAQQLFDVNKELEEAPTACRPVAVLPTRSG